MSYPYVPNIFTLLLIKQIFQKNKSSREVSERSTQFWIYIELPCFLDQLWSNASVSHCVENIAQRYLAFTIIVFLFRLPKSETAAGARLWVYFLMFMLLRTIGLSKSSTSYDINSDFNYSILSWWIYHRYKIS